MTTYYTYRSFEEFDSGRSYIGVRKCPGCKTPETDSYLGSYTDKTFSPTAKEILGVYYSKEEALQAEIDLHKKFDVARNPHFANRACITSTRFSHGMTGRKHTEETKRKMSEAKSGENNYMYGRTKKDHPRFGESLSEETKAKISEAMSGENHPMYGKTHSKETREKMSKAQSGENHPMYGKKLSEETRSKLSKSLSRENNPMYGKNHSKESREKMSGKNNYGYTPRNWYHPIHGEVLQKSASELIKMFPEQNLNAGALSQVALKKKPYHKGWEIC
jgi:hypothetical protein